MRVYINPTPAPTSVALDLGRAEVPGTRGIRQELNFTEALEVLLAD